MKGKVINLDNLSGYFANDANSRRTVKDMIAVGTRSNSVGFLPRKT
jgi:hypothetical protein